MPPEPQKRITDKQVRSCVIEIVPRADGEEGESRILEFSMSSEYPVERWYGREILSHKEGAINWERFADGGPVLTDHDSWSVDRMVGVVEKAWIDKKKARVRVRMAEDDPRADMVLSKIRQGIIRSVSVGYRINEFTEKKLEGSAKEVTATLWTPYEVSFVAVPADPSVGVGRTGVLGDEPGNPQLTDGGDMPPDNPSPESGTRTEPTTQLNPETAPEAPDIGKIQRESREAERDRVKAIREMAEKHKLDELGRKAIDAGTSYEEFNRQALEKIAERNNSLRTEQPAADGDVDLTPREVQGFSLRRLIAAQMFGASERGILEAAAFELEVVDAARQAMPAGYQSEGVVVPERALTGVAFRDQEAYIRELQARATITTTAAGPGGANLVADVLMPGSFIEYLYNSAVLMRAGMTMLRGLTGNIEIPRQSGTSAAGVVAEDAPAPDQNPVFDQVTLSAKHVAVFGSYSRNMLLQSTPDIERLIRMDFAKQMGLKIDNLGLYGTGSGGQPTGLKHATGINFVDQARAGGAKGPTYIEMVKAISLTKAANALLSIPSWFIESTMWEYVMTTTKSTGDTNSNFILDPDKGDRIVGKPYFETEALTNGDIWFGSWGELICGEWGGLDVIVDPYTESRRGRRNITMFKSIDYAVRHPKAFTLSNATGT